MKRHEATIFDFQEDPDDKFCVTSHESCHSPSMTIHCTGDSGYSGFSMYITKEQAKDLIGKLQEGIINLEVYERAQKKEVEKCHS